MILHLLLLLIPLLSASSSDSSNSNKKSDGRVNLGDGNYFTFGIDDICGGFHDLWEDPSIPDNQRNNIGRAKFQTSLKVRQAKRLIKLGKSYEIGYDLTQDIPIANFDPVNRFYNISAVNCIPLSDSHGFCQSGIATNAIGNIGTQFDGIGHIYVINDKNERIYHNNFNEISTFNKFKYIGIENYPTFFTRAFLLDIPAYLGLDILDDGYEITKKDVLGTLKRQRMNVNNLSKGDVALVYTGYGSQHWNDGPNGDFYNGDKTPGLLKEVFRDLFYDRGVMIVGSDTSDVEKTGFNAQGHVFWMVCSGGFFHEGLLLDDWISDARNGMVPYIGAYTFSPFRVEGACCSGGIPTIYV